MACFSTFPEAQFDKNVELTMMEKFPGTCCAASRSLISMAYTIKAIENRMVCLLLKYYVKYRNIFVNERECELLENAGG
jgi:hypothetical protein